jgi:RND family efflux transporter MFP subunit
MSSRSSTPASASLPPSRGGGRLAAIATVVVALVIVVWGILGRLEARAELKQRAAEQAIIAVAVTTAEHGAETDPLVLPGSVEAYTRAPIYARTSGYLKRWLVDIGTPVKAGQLLAEIETPEIDQQLQQAAADVETAAANEALARSTAQRWQQLFEAQAVSQQDLDAKLGAAAADKAALAAARARLEQLRAQESFKRVVAPFDGIVTARNTDVGALINAGNSSGAQLFEIADTHKLRVYTRIPQTYAAATRPGASAEIHFAEYPGRSFPAHLTRTSGALDPGARTLLAQLEIDNPRGELLPGGYAEVHLQLPARKDTLRLPSNALLFRADGLSVATVGSDDLVTLNKVTVGRDLGTQIEILSGLAAGTRVIVNPPDSIADGAKVRVIAPEPHPAAPAKS